MQMRKRLRRVPLFLFSVLLCTVFLYYAPSLYMELFGTNNTLWISEQLSKTVEDKNELIVYQINTTGQETVSEEAWLIGTVQQVILPYAFEMQYTVDLNCAQIVVVGETIEVRVPPPSATYYKLTVDEENIVIDDWLYRLTPERYAEIVSETQERLYDLHKDNEEDAQNAWLNTIRNLESLFQSIVESSTFGQTCGIQVIADESLIS